MPHQHGPVVVVARASSCCRASRGNSSNTAIACIQRNKTQQHGRHCEEARPACLSHCHRRPQHQRHASIFPSPHGRIGSQKRVQARTAVGCCVCHSLHALGTKHVLPRGLQMELWFASIYLPAAGCDPNPLKPTARYISHVRRAVEGVSVPAPLGLIGWVAASLRVPRTSFDVKPY